MNILRIRVALRRQQSTLVLVQLRPAVTHQSGQIDVLFQTGLLKELSSTGMTMTVHDGSTEPHNKRSDPSFLLGLNPL